jgi:Family of unknown function (DUF6152)
VQLWSARFSTAGLRIVKTATGVTEAETFSVLSPDFSRVSCKRPGAALSLSPPAFAERQVIRFHVLSQWKSRFEPANVLRGALAVAGALMIATPCAAHHSFAMFDRTKQVTLHGTVKQLEWTNPHCFLQLLVEDHGDSTEWSIEMNSPLDMYRVGWRPGTFKPGDRVTVIVNPTRRGDNGGSLVSATGPNGRTLSATTAPTEGSHP